MKLNAFAGTACRALAVAIVVLGVGAAEAATHSPIRTMLSGGLGTLWALLFGML